MNFNWGVLEYNRGSLIQPGSLTELFEVLNRARLGGKKPDDHTLSATFTQILEGYSLAAWHSHLKTKGYKTITDFAKSSPSPSELCKLARQVLIDYIMPFKTLKSPSANPSHNPDHDRAHSNLRILICSLLYHELARGSIRDGDFGRYEDIMPDLIKIFRAQGQKNYCSELLHFLHNLKYVWPYDFA